MVSSVIRLPNWRNLSLIVTLVVFLVGMVLSILFARYSSPGVPEGTENAIDLGRLPLSFEQNVGQTNTAVRYLARGKGGIFYFTESEVVFSLQAPNPKNNQFPSKHMALSGQGEMSPVLSPGVVRLRFVDPNSNLQIVGGELLPGKINYLIGSDASKWRTDLSTYSSLTYAELYPGIDLSYVGTGALLKGTYTVAPMTDATQIRWRYDGAKTAILDDAGNLQITIVAPDGEELALSEQAPVAWQEVGGRKVDVSISYSVAPDGEIRFAIGSYDRSQPLTIDPTIIYSTFLGGTNEDLARDMALDSQNNIYLTGLTDGGFPVVNAYDPTFSGVYDAFVTKLSADGSTIVYSTYLGGSDYDEPFGIAVDASSNVYVAGVTRSIAFPTTSGAFQTIRRGPQDGFLTKLNSNGNGLVYSTYFGGTANDKIQALTIDATRRVYVAGETRSDDFPIAFPVQNIRVGSADAFVARFNSAGNSLDYSTYLGGSGLDEATVISVDVSDRAFVAGIAPVGSANDFPRVNAFQQTYGGGSTDGFVTKFAPDGRSLDYSTFLGGSGQDFPYGIIADSAGSVCVSGHTTSTDFPLENPIQQIHGGGDDGFVTRFQTNGSALVFSTLLGGSGSDSTGDIELDALGNYYLAGYSGFPNFPVLHPYQAVLKGPVDAIVAVLDSNGKSLLFSTYLGGSDYEGAISILVNQTGEAYVAGYTRAYLQTLKVGKIGS